MEVRNRFKGLNLIECLMNYGQRFMTLYRRQGSRPFPRKRNAKKRKKIAEERREAKGKGQKEIYANLKAELQRIATRDSLLIARKPPQRSVQRNRGKQ